MRAQLGPVTLDIRDGWADVTDDVESEDDDPPWTLARQSADACGSFQFTFALYESGPIPNMSPKDLAGLLREFGEAHNLGKGSGKIVESGSSRLAAATFRDGEWTVRAWYVSDGRNLAKVTYTVAVGDDFASELAECERMVRTIRFPQAARARR